MTGVLIGIGMMAAVDEIVFHQLLAWHHFYDRSTSGVALLSDGLLHSAELIILVAGFFMFAELRRDGLSRNHATAGFFLGAGGFQIFDGLVDHKLLRVHQIRYGVDDLWLYDVLWNLSGFALLVVGIVLLRRAHTATGFAQ